MVPSHGTFTVYMSLVSEADGWRFGVVALAILAIEQRRAEGNISLEYPDGCRFTDVVAAGRHSWTLGIVGRGSLHRSQQRTLRL